MDRQNLRPALRYVVEGQGQPVLSVAAKNAWWNWPRYILDTVALAKGISLAACVSHFDVLYTLTQATIECSDEQALDILEKKLAKLQASKTCLQEIMMVDEAQQCLDEADRDYFRKQQTKGKEEIAELEVFTKSYTQKYVQHRGGPPAAKKFCLQAYTGKKKLVETCQSLCKVVS